MTKRLTEKANSYAALKATFELAENKPIWSALPAFDRGVTQLYGSMNVLGALAQAQGTPTTGITVNKDRLAASVVNRTLRIAGAVATYAVEIGDAELEAKVDFSKSDLAKLRDSELDDEAQRIHDLAADLVEKKAKKMAEYGLVPETLTDLQSAITAYSALVGTPRAAIGGKAAVTQAITAETARADGILARQLDRLIVQFEEEHPQFVAAYWSARAIVASGSRSTNGKPAPAAKPAVAAA